ncbi:MAG: hypothetical protein AAF512_11135 [Pseudomonadota bacterium]
MGLGKGGDIVIQTPSLYFSGLNTELSSPLEMLSRISTNVFGGGSGGDIRLEVSVLDMQPGLIQSSAGISFASSEDTGGFGGLGNAGSVYINAGKAQLTDSTITTFGQSNVGGNINLDIQEYAVIRNSEVSSDAVEGGGTIQFQTGSPLIAENSVINAQAFFGPGGDIIFSSNPLADSSTTIVTSPGGEIIVKSPDGEVEANQILTTGRFVAVEFTDQRCARGPVSRFFNAGLKGLPQTPTSLILHMPKLSDSQSSAKPLQTLALNRIFNRQSCVL